MYKYAIAILVLWLCLCGAADLLIKRGTEYIHAHHYLQF